MTAINRVLLLGNRAMSIFVADFLRRQPGVVLLAVANPDDNGLDMPGALSLVRRLKAWGIAYIQPKSISGAEVVGQLAAFKADLAISCSYARIIPKNVIDLPLYGCLNIHFSDLPLNRGCLPVIWTIASLEPHYAATLHKADVGIDDGDIVAQDRRPLVPGMTAGEVNAACATLGFDLFRAFWTQSRETGLYSARAQDAKAVTYHSFRFPHDRWIPWTASAERVAGIINAHSFLPHPSARTRVGAGAAEVYLLGPALVADSAGGAAPGTVVTSGPELTVACGQGTIAVQFCREGDAAVSVAGRFAAGQMFISPQTDMYHA